MGSHMDELMERLPLLQPQQENLLAALAMLTDCFAEGGKALVCGNGGSAADADHWSGELLKGFASRRPLTREEAVGLPPELAAGLQRALPMIPLTQFTALATAYGNDCDGTLVYAQLTLALGRPGDVLVGISTSGQARNVCRALEVARARGLKTLGLTGPDGGAMKPLCDVCIRVPGTSTHRVQELHLPVYHVLCLELEQHFFG